jgi:hypothetical protein
MNENEEAEDRATMARLAQRLRESTGKQGVYYVLPFPARWRLYAFAWEDFGDLWHNHAWRRYVVSDLAEAWAGILHRKAEDLQKELMPLWKGVPRGRVERLAPQEFTIFHGNDLGDTGLTPERIQNAFELARSKVVWSFDPHEQQDPTQRVTLMGVLRDEH